MGSSINQVRSVSIYINGKEADLTLKQLEKGGKQLRNELALLVPGTEAFKRKLMELRETRKIMNDVRDDINGVGGAFGWLKTEIGKVGALAAGALGFQFITQQFQNIISQNAKLSDSLADVMKTTGLTEQQVRRLNLSLKEIDTRTSRAELLGLAEVAGKLGITGELDVLGFVRAADQIGVALGKDLGSTESAVNDLGKLVEIFKIKETFGLEQSLLKTGSAINDLGAAGTANEGYIVEFTKRMGGIAPAANISIQDMLGLAAVMDELGVNAEAGSTAVGQFVVGMGQDIPTYAKIAGMSVQEFGKLLNTDGNKALIAVLKNANSTGMGLQGLAEKMGMIGADGARAIASLGVLSNNIELLEKRQNMANKSFETGTSLTQEFNTKNNTFGATLDKVSKKLGALTSNTTLTGWLTRLVIGFGQFIDMLNRNMNAIGNMTKLLLVAGTAWGTYRTYILLANSGLASFLINLVRGETVMALSRTTTIALAGAKALLTGNIAKAQQAFRLLNITMAANPIGLVVAAIGAAVVAYSMFNDELTETEKQLKNASSIQAEASKNTQAEKDQIGQVVSALKNKNLTHDQQAAAIQRLRSITGGYLQDLKDDELLTDKGTQAIARYIAMLDRKATAEAANAKIQELRKKDIDLQTSELSIDDISWTDDISAFVKSGTRDSYEKNRRKAAWKNRREERNVIGQQIKAIQDQFAPEMTEQITGSAPASAPSGMPAPGETEAARKAREKLAKKAKKDLDDLMNDYRKLIIEAEKAAGNDLDKKLIELDQKYDKIIQRLRKAGKTVEADLLQNSKDGRVASETETFNQAQRKDIYESQKKELGNNLQNDENRLGGRRADGEIDEQTFNQEKERLETTHLENMYNLATFWGQSTLEWETQLTDQRLANNQREYDQRRKILEAQRNQDQQYLESKRAVEQAKNQLVEAGIGMLYQFFGKSKTAYIGILALEKALAIGKITTNLASEIAGYWAFNAPLGPAGWVTAGAMTKLATTRALLSGASVLATGIGQAVGALTSGGDGSSAAGSNNSAPALPVGRGYETGGYTSIDYSKPQGFVNRPTMYMNSSTGSPFLAGEGNKTEYVVSSTMLKNPSVANFVGMLEAMRTNRKFENGGYTSTVTIPPPSDPPIVDIDMSQVVALLSQMVAAQKETGSRPLNLNYRLIEEYQNDLAKIRNDVDA